MMNVMKDCSIDGKDLRIIKNLYWNQSASVKIDHDKREEVKIPRGCILSPFIFNLYSERILQETVEHLESGILLMTSE